MRCPIDLGDPAASGRQTMLRSRISWSLLKASAVILLALGVCARAEDGEELAKRWCSSCHLFPEPQLLDKRTWMDHVLPEMGARLGFRQFRGRIFGPNPSAPPGVYAPEPLMSPAEWERIVSWYESSAPERLLLPPPSPRQRADLFEIELPERGLPEFPVGTAVFIDEASHRLVVGDSYEMELELYAEDLSPLGAVRLGGPISRISRLPTEGYLVTTMTDTVAPAGRLQGELVEVSISGASAVRLAARRLVRGLNRPVDAVGGDFNDDGLSDYVVASFGLHIGKLSLYLGQPDGTLREVMLLEEPGSISVRVDADDLLVLITQANERLVRLADFAGGKPVAEEIIRRFPPSQGSSSLNLLDFNGDGLLDLLYTAGDNGDISSIFKPYHGVYLFLAQPDGSYRQQMFFHLDGAYSAVARDFDQDGDLDIAAIAYFANIDIGVDQAGFVYLQNHGDGFEPQYVEGIGSLGRFVALAAGDIDGDGDQDIALANLAFGALGPLDVAPALQERWIKSPHFLLLRNRLR